jgi:thiamine biosynthesis lipoprotein
MMSRIKEAEEEVTYYKKRHDDMFSSVSALNKRIEELESRWSRFRPDSEVSRLNAAPVGQAVEVSPDTLVLVDLALQGYAVSRGAFDPSMLVNLVDAGYGESLVDDLESGEPLVREVAGTAPVVHGDLTQEFVVDADTGTVTRNSGLQFDPGGLGKGLAADLVADDLMAAGAEGVLVNLGGDTFFTSEWLQLLEEDGPRLAQAENVSQIGRDIAIYGYGVTAAYLPAGIIRVVEP